MKIPYFSSLIYVFFFFSPFQVNAQWEITNTFGGEVISILETKDTLWAGTYSGLYFSTDNAVDWVRHPAFELKSAITGLHDDGQFLYAFKRTIQKDSSSNQNDVKVTLVRSSDRGKSWNNAHDFNPYPWTYSNSFRVKLIPYAGGFVLSGISATSSLISFSKDYGTSWQDIPIPAGFQPANNYSIDSTSILIRSPQSSYLYSKDVGQNWDTLPGTNDFMLNIEALSKDKIVALFRTDSATYYNAVSSDFGNSWYPIPDSINQKLFTYRWHSQNGDTLIGNSGLQSQISLDFGRTWQPWTYLKEYYPTYFSNQNAYYVSSGQPLVFNKNTEEWEVLPLNKVPLNGVQLFESDNSKLLVRGATGIQTTLDGGVNWMQHGHIWDYIGFQNDTFKLFSKGKLYNAPNYGQDSTYLIGSFQWIEPFAGFGQTQMIASDEWIFGYRRVVDFGHLMNKKTGDSKYVILPDDGLIYPHILTSGDSIFIYDEYGKSYYSYDAGTSWETGLINGNSSQRLAVFHTNRQLFAFDQYNFVVSNDFGKNWTYIAPRSIIDGSVDRYKLVKHKGVLYLTNYGLGILHSIDGGKSWEKTNFPDIFCTNLIVHQDTLYIGTLFNGVWRQTQPILVNSSEAKSKSDASFEVLPNPTSEWITVKWEPKDQTTFSLIQADGKICFRESFDKTEKHAVFDIRAYPAGIYFLTINSGSLRTTIPVLVER